jgi:uncharacterized protein with PQ loop repeat
MDGVIRAIGLVAAVTLPLWNLPLIARIERRKSSEDISLAWALGVLISLLAMFPSALRSSDIVFKAFSIVNLALFGAVVVQVLRYHHRASPR